VTERLQQILQTVRRDPTHAQRVRLDLNPLLEELRRTWGDMARDKWKLSLTLEQTPEPLWIEGDLSHLQQAFENLLFNARDATFEQRTYLRQQARTKPAAGSDASEAASQERRQALIAAASWEGEVRLRTYRQDDTAVVEVCDNGIGMTEEVRRRCTEAHFSTKRNNALFAGLSAGMGLGLSFIQVILEHHHATMTIESAPLQGAIFRICFPLSTAGEPGTATDASIQAGLAENGQDR
jgi:signal transduction histidine kinase